MFFTWKICSSQYLSARKGDCFLGITLLKWGIPSRGRRGDPSVHHSRNTTRVGWFGYESLFSLRESICCLVCRSLLWVFCFVGAGLTKPTFRPNNFIFSKHTRDTQASERAFIEETVVITTGEWPISTTLFPGDTAVSLNQKKRGHGVPLGVLERLGVAESEFQDTKPRPWIKAEQSSLSS